MGSMRTGRTTAKDGHPRLAALGRSCPDHVLRTKVRPMVLDLPPEKIVADRVGGTQASWGS
jgi:rhamnose utilization protein RhaD (predicted bifunctional aldolase and dehydrogenase)